MVDQVSSSSPEVFHERVGSFRAYYGVRFLITIRLRLSIYIFTAEPYRRDVSELGLKTFLDRFSP